MFAVEVSRAGMFGHLNEFDLVILPDQAAVDNYFKTAADKLGLDTLKGVPDTVDTGPVILTHVNPDNELEVSGRKSTESELMRSSALRWHQSLFISIRPTSKDGSRMDLPKEIVMYRLSAYTVSPTTDFRKPEEWHPETRDAAAAEEAEKIAAAKGATAVPAPSTVQ